MDITIIFLSANNSIYRNRLSLLRFWRQILTGMLCILLTTGGCYASDRGLLDLSIEELGEIKVTSVSKKSERLASAAASIYVITADNIERAGARSLPEALRLAPNLHVAQINSNQFAISARGFNSSTANKLLVLIDGRAVYTPLYSGVFWDAQEVVLKDVDRIEIISGPGGTLWGANAVNGVINIITKPTSATQGNLVHASGGNVERSVAVRHGGELQAVDGNYRVYAKFSLWDQSVRANGSGAVDEWDRDQAGFRTDWRSGLGNFTLQGDAFRNSIDQPNADDQSNEGANLLARWNSQLSGGSELKVQTYIDHTTRDSPGVYREKLDIVDLDIQHSLPNQDGQQFNWGLGYRIAEDRVDNTRLLAFLPAEKQLQWANLYAQQEAQLWSNWILTLGAKLERNDYTGTELLPKLKLSWQATDNRLLWLRLARSVRAPARIDRELYAPGTPPYLLAGGANFRSEIADMIELGWREQASQNFAYSLVAFHSQYDYLRSFDLNNGSYTIGNKIEGTVDGLEALASYQVTTSWALEISSVLLDEHFNGADLALSPPGNDPDWQFSLSSKWNLNNDTYLDIALRRVGQLPAPYVPAYTLLNVHYGWYISDQIKIGITGRNLLERYHQEFSSGNSDQALTPIQIERALNIAVTVRF